MLLKLGTKKYKTFLFGVTVKRLGALYLYYVFSYLPLYFNQNAVKYYDIYDCFKSLTNSKCIAIRLSVNREMFQSE